MQHSSKHTAIAFLLGALLTGGALGFTAATVMGRETRAGAYASTRDQLARTLELSPEQRARFDRIVDERDHTIDSLMAPLDAQMEALKPSIRRVRDSARVELRALLSAPQQREFDRYLAMMREREARRDSAARSRRQQADSTPGVPASSATSAGGTGQD